MLESVHSYLPKTCNCSYRLQEDLPENNFTENVIFYGGNYVVIPGITSYGSEIFRNLSEAIFICSNKLTNSFKLTVHDAIKWLLELSKIIFDSIGINRYIFIKEEKSQIQLPVKLIDYSVSNQEIEKLSKRFQLSVTVLSDFIIDPTNKAFENDDVDKNPLIKQPLFILDHRLFFVLPSVKLSALNEYILAKAKESNSDVELLKIYNDRLWMQLLKRLKNMWWIMTNIVTPENKISTKIREVICRIDDNKLAYLCYIEAKTDNGHTVSPTLEFMESEAVQSSETINERINEVNDYLKNKEEFRDYQFLTLVIIGSVGRNMAYSFTKPMGGDEIISFSIFEFLRLADYENWNMLSLWKFAKIFRITTERMFILPTSTIDTYWVYQKNKESFYHTDDSNPNALLIAPGCGSEIIRNAIKEEDLHGAPVFKGGSIKVAPVKRTFDFLNIYEPVEEGKNIERLLECYKFPLWIISDVATEAKHNKIMQLFINAIAFWLYKMYKHLDSLNDIGEAPFYITIVLEQEFYKERKISELSNKNVIFSHSINDRDLIFNIPFSLAFMLYSPDNLGERLMMVNLLRAFNSINGINLSEKQITGAIEESMPLGPAKMILFLDSARNPCVDDRWIIPNRYLSDAETSLILDELPHLISDPNPIPAKIENKSEKIRFCNSIVMNLIGKLRTILSKYDSAELLKRLILIHEGYVREREYQKIYIPPRIACFSEIDKEVEKILKKDKQLISSTLAIRCVIEFIAADSKYERKSPNFDAIDQMLAIMREIINFGFLSDTIFLDLDDPEIGLLPSGRLGINNTFYYEKMVPFSTARAYTEIESYVESFPGKFHKTTYNPESLSDSFQIKTDTSFKADWGISLTGILKICGALWKIAEQNQSSVCEMEKNILIDELKRLTLLSIDEINHGLSKLSLFKREDFNKAPHGYFQNDIYPWKYNREFAFLRRPLVIIKDTSGKENYYWGMRNTYAASQQILDLIYSGKFKTYKEPNIEALIGEISIGNGKDFRKEVKNWFKNQDRFKTVDHEVSIEPKGHICSEKNLGDIDIFSIDEERKIIYLIECKDTDQARNIHEMKGELDKYLGRRKGEGLIIKHVERDKYIQQNKEQLKKFMTNLADHKIVALIITSEDLPLTYIKNKLPLPIVSFPKLKRVGVNILQSLT